jgi:hypothetical protein
MMVCHIWNHSLLGLCLLSRACSQNDEQSPESERCQRCYCFTVLYIFIVYFFMCTHGATIVKDSNISYSYLSCNFLNLQFESAILHQEQC